MSSQHDDLPSIDPSALDAVTGATGSGSTSPTDDPAVAAALQGIQQSLADLKGNNTNNNGNSFAQMLPLLMMLFGGGGFSFSFGVDRRWFR